GFVVAASGPVGPIRGLTGGGARALGLLLNGGPGGGLRLSVLFFFRRRVRFRRSVFFCLGLGVGHGLRHCPGLCRFVRVRVVKDPLRTIAGALPDLVFGVVWAGRLLGVFQRLDFEPHVIRPLLLLGVRQLGLVPAAG